MSYRGTNHKATSYGWDAACAAGAPGPGGQLLSSNNQAVQHPARGAHSQQISVQSDHYPSQDQHGHVHYRHHHHHQPQQVRSSGNSTGNRTQSSGSEFWYCHYGVEGNSHYAGPWLMATTPKCLTCNHTRCVYCVVRSHSGAY